MTLPEFLAQHVKPYDPATDDYEREPFAFPVKAGKNTSIYNAHSYHTKVPPQGIEPYIRHYTEPGEVVLDVLQLGQLEGLPKVLTPELVEYLRQLLQEAGLRTVNVNVVAKMPDELQAIEEAQVPATVKAFEKALREAFDEAKVQNPDATKVKISLR